MKNIRYSKFNERLSEDRSENWRQLEVPEASPVPSEHQTYLEYPIEFSMQDGEIRDIKVSEEEPEWATNMKKSLVSLIKVQLPSQVPEPQYHGFCSHRAENHILVEPTNLMIFDDELE